MVSILGRDAETGAQRLISFSISCAAEEIRAKHPKVEALGLWR
jgi:hypothetical protein